MTSLPCIEPASSTAEGPVERLSHTAADASVVPPSFMVLLLGEGNLSFAHSVVKKLSKSTVFKRYQPHKIKVKKEEAMRADGAENGKMANQPTPRRLPLDIRDCYCHLLVTTFDSRTVLTSKYPETVAIMDYFQTKTRLRIECHGDVNATCIADTLHLDATNGHDTNQNNNNNNNNNAIKRGNNNKQENEKENENDTITVTPRPLSPTFHLIIFNNPHIGFEDFVRHRSLLSHFFASARAAIDAAAAASEGCRSETPPADLVPTQVVVALCDDQPKRWDLLGAASRSGFVCVAAVPLTPAEFPSYSNKRHQSDAAFPYRHMIQYYFMRYDGSKTSKNAAGRSVVKALQALFAQPAIRSQVGEQVSAWEDHVRVLGENTGCAGKSERLPEASAAQGTMDPPFTCLSASSSSSYSHNNSNNNNNNDISDDDWKCRHSAMDCFLKNAMGAAKVEAPPCSTTPSSSSSSSSAAAAGLIDSEWADRFGCPLDEDDDTGLLRGFCFPLLHPALAFYTGFSIHAAPTLSSFSSSPASAETSFIPGEAAHYSPYIRPDCLAPLLALQLQLELQRRDHQRGKKADAGAGSAAIMDVYGRNDGHLSPPSPATAELHHTAAPQLGDGVPPIAIPPHLDPAVLRRPLTSKETAKLKRYMEKAHASKKRCDSISSSHVGKHRKPALRVSCGVAPPALSCAICEAEGEARTFESEGDLVQHMTMKHSTRHALLHPNMYAEAHRQVRLRPAGHRQQRENEGEAQKTDADNYAEANTRSGGADGEKDDLKNDPSAGVECCTCGLCFVDQEAFDMHWRYLSPQKPVSAVAEPMCTICTPPRIFVDERALQQHQLLKHQI